MLIITRPHAGRVGIRVPAWNSLNAPIVGVHAFCLDSRADAKVVTASAQVRPDGPPVPTHVVRTARRGPVSVFLRPGAIQTRDEIRVLVEVNPSWANASWAFLPFYPTSTPATDLFWSAWADKDWSEVPPDSTLPVASPVAKPSGVGIELFLTMVLAVFNEVSRLSREEEYGRRATTEQWLLDCHDRLACFYTYFWRLDIETTEELSMYWKFFDPPVPKDQCARMRALGELQAWLEERVKARAAGRKPPKANDQETKVELGSAIVLGLAATIFEGEPLSLKVGFGGALLAFCSGALGWDPAWPGHGAPDSWKICTISEIAFAARECGAPSTRAWHQLLPILKVALVLFDASYVRGAGIGLFEDRLTCPVIPGQDDPDIWLIPLHCYVKELEQLSPEKVWVKVEHDYSELLRKMTVRPTGC